MSNKIFVLCPGWLKTGGPEALHQLAHKLRTEASADAFICYFDKRNESVINHYKELYNVREAPLSDIKGNVLIFPEIVDPVYASSLGAAYNWVWWLSANRNFSAKRYAGIGNLCQSEYAASIVRMLNGKSLYLTDYISSFHREEGGKHKRKKDIIVFGPKSAFFAFMLKTCDRHLPLKPIIGKNRTQTIELLSSAKVYIDFGWHQGRDRMPREAALYDCLVVIGKLGAADNNVDYPLKDEYKLNIDDVAGTAALLRKYLKDYERRKEDFSAYKEWIKAQEQQYSKEVEELARHADNPQAYSYGNINEEIDKFILLKQRESFFHRRVTDLMADGIIRGSSLAIKSSLDKLRKYAK